MKCLKDVEEEVKVMFSKEAMPIAWKPPVEGVYKVNFDASIKKNVVTGMGLIVRDWEG